MFLLDTNHCSEIIFGNPVILTRMQTLLPAGVATSVIVQGELLLMAKGSERRAANLKLVHEFLQRILIHPITEAIAEIYSDLKSDIILQFGPKERAKRRRTKIQDLGFGDNDLWIAATARHHSLTLISTDSDFTRIKQVCDLNIESWL
jgi:tRNA(fMet)-specific endonuclease VapC